MKSEHQEQTALIKWARRNGIDLLFSIPNGEHRAQSTANRLKKEGLQPGIPDLFLAVPRGTFHGLFIEMKSLTGKPSKLQMEWLAALTAMGYRAVVCRGFEEAKAEIEGYLRG